MYAHVDPERHPVRLFQLPNTLAGDAGVTIIIQCLLTWFIEWNLLHHDLKTGSVQPIGFITEPSHPLLRWFLLLKGNDAEPSQSRVLRWFQVDHTEPKTRSVRGWAHLLFQQALRGFIICFLSFCILWGPSVGILTAVGTKSGGDWVFGRTWAPQVFKGVFGGVLALLTTPLMAVFWLVKAGWNRDDEMNDDSQEA